jgi:hypothetical protein
MKTPLLSFLEARSLLALEESELPASTLAVVFTAPRGAPAPLVLLRRRLWPSLQLQRRRPLVLRLVLGGVAREGTQ